MNGFQALNRTKVELKYNYTPYIGDPADSQSYQSGIEISFSTSITGFISFSQSYQSGIEICEL